MKNSPKTQLAHLSLAGLGVSLMLLSAPGCGSSDPVPKGNVVCDPGRSEPCACSDGSTGAQTCNESGTGFGSCSCGGAGGSAGDGGNGGTGASGGAAGDGGTGASGGSAGTGGAGATGGSAGVAGSAGSTTGGASGSGGSAGAVNCPDNLAVDCSGECQTPKAECAYGCDLDGLFVRANGDLPLRVRLPRPSNSPDCCAPVAHMVGIQHQELSPMRFTVDPPWRLVVPADTEIVNGELCMHNSSQCLALPLGQSTVWVYTDDPNAPSRDVLIEAANSCP